MCHYTTLWNVNVSAQKQPCSRAEWSELPCKTQSFETVAEKYSSNDVSTILLTNKKILTVVTPKEPKESPLYATEATKKKDITTKRCAHDQRSDSHWWHQLASHKWPRKPKFNTWSTRLLNASSIKLCWYNNYCPLCLRSQASSLFFLFFSRTLRTVPGAHGAWHSQLSCR